MFGDHSGEFNRYGIRIFGLKVLTITETLAKQKNICYIRGDG